MRDRVPEIIRQKLDDFDVGEGRTIDERTVQNLMQSIQKIGLRTPVTVRTTEETTYLVVGFHRYEAVKRLGHEYIDTVDLRDLDDVDDAFSRSWQICENLHRAPLTEQEYADQVAEWATLASEPRVFHDGAPLGGEQPKEKGQRKTARSLGVSAQKVARAQKIASLSDETKAAASAAGIKTQKDLLELAKTPPEQQADKVAEIAARPKQSKAQKPPKPRVVGGTDTRGVAYYVRAVMDLWNQAPAEARREILSRIDRSEAA